MKKKESEMKQVIRGLIAATLMCGALIAPAQQSSATGSSKAKRKVPAKAAGPSVSERLQAMQDSIQAQQQQIQQLMQQLQSRDGQIQQLQEQMTTIQSTATQAQQKADTAAAVGTQQQADVTAVKSDVTDLKSNATNTALSLQETQKNVQAAMESPMALHYKGIAITPGGFLAAEFVRRSRALAADVNSPLNTIPMPGASQAASSEFFGSGRQSRVSMLAETKFKDAKVAGYVEADFLSAAVTSNNNQSNSYSLRQRQAYGQAAFDNGWTITGGQMWSLLTETKKGMDNRSEALPMTIDAQYTSGFSWARQFGLRLTKNFNNKLWAGISIENPQATVTAHGNGTNFLVGSAGAGGGLYNSAVTGCSTTSTATTTTTTTVTSITTCTPAASYAFNPSPDVIGKLVFEPGFGHYEIFGVYARFRDRAFPCGDATLTVICDSVTGPSALGAFNSSKNGGGIGANARWSFMNKRVDFGLHALGGSGVGRYGSAGLADATVREDGTLRLLKSYQGLATLEWHGPKLDVYFNAGAEYASRGWDLDTNPNSTSFNKPVGYGSPLFNNSGCFTETPPGNSGGFVPGSLSGCTADTRALIEGSTGFWIRFYQGPKGRLQWGPQFSYVSRQTWSGKTGIEPHGIDGMVFSSFRYYLP
jgi:hypothetical protein